jgi:hypothetical protein
MQVNAAFIKPFMGLVATLGGKYVDDALVRPKGRETVI